jgi:CheY-like chemotaxis protein
VVTDLVMPEIGGLELVSEIREQHPQIPVIVVTSQGSEVAAVEALKRGAANYVPKQMLAARLRETVHEVLAISSVQQAHVQLMDSVDEIRTKYTLKNDPLLIDSLTVNLVDSVRRLGLCDASQARCVGVAAKEALNNALYHGNLEVDGDARREGRYRYLAIARERMEQQPFKDRSIRVETLLSREQLSITVRDQGRGFDPRSLPDLGDLQNLDQPCGRGIVLMRTFMDEVTYNERGNSVTLVKHCPANRGRGASFHCGDRAARDGARAP